MNFANYQWMDPAIDLDELKGLLMRRAFDTIDEQRRAPAPDPERLSAYLEIVDASSQLTLW